MGGVRTGTASEILPAHCVRTPAAGDRSERVGTDVDRHRPCDEAGLRMDVRDLLLRVRALAVPRRVERELEDELAFHIERETQKQIAAGVSPAEARRRARVRFGPVAL